MTRPTLNKRLCLNNILGIQIFKKRRLPLSKHLKTKLIIFRTSSNIIINQRSFLSHSLNRIININIIISDIGLSVS
jgi:hypothetical protein